MARDLDRAREERDFRLNPPEFAPGFGKEAPVSNPNPFMSNNGGGGAPSPFVKPNPFGVSPSGSASDPFGGPPVGEPTGGPIGGPPNPFGGTPRPPMGGPPNPFGGTPRPPMGGPPNPFGGMGAAASPYGPKPGFGGPGQQPEPPKQDVLDKIFDGTFQAAGAAGKATWQLSKEMGKSARSSTVVDWTKFFSSYFVTSLIMFAVSLALALLSVPFERLSFGVPVFIASTSNALISGVGWGITFFSVKSSGHTPKVKEPEPAPLPLPPPAPSLPPPPMFDPSSEDDSEDDIEWEDESEDDWEDESEDDWEDEGDEDYDEEVDVDKLKENLVEITPGTQTRAFLFEQASKALPPCTRDFAEIEEIEDGSDEFIELEDILREAAESTGVKEENLPTLTRASRTLFVTLLEFTRTPQMKVDKIANEFLGIYRRDDFSQDQFPDAFVISDEFGSRATLTLFNVSDKPMVTLKDIYTDDSVKKFVTDPKNALPVILGVGSQGEPYYLNMAKAQSLIVSGLPRKGKSWFVRSILDQMGTYASPEDLHFYIGDPKDEISEFATYMLPHVQRTEFDPDGVINMLQFLCGPERERRSRLFGEHKVNKIEDFHRKAPNIPMPMIYVVLDEMLSLATYMEGPSKSTYRQLINVMVSQLPALGIKGIFIAHRLTDQIIPKTSYALIDFLASIGSDTVRESLNLSTGQKFEYVTDKVGDLAFKTSLIKNGNPTYARAAIIGPEPSDLDNYEDFVAYMWSKLCPGVTRSSGGHRRGQDAPLDKLAREEDQPLARLVPADRKERILTQDDVEKIRTEVDSAEGDDADFWA